MTVEEWKKKNPPILKKPQTNADRIRAMSDEELAAFLDTINACTCSYAMGKSPCGGEDCPCWLDWLKSPFQKNPCGGDL